MHKSDWEVEVSGCILDIAFPVASSHLYQSDTWPKFRRSLAPGRGVHTPKELPKDHDIEELCFLQRLTTLFFRASAQQCASARRLPLQRLFSTFPSGRPGFGLLLLRATLGGIALLLGILELTGSTERSPTTWMAALLFLASGVALVVGFMTPLACALVGVCVLGVVFSWIPAPPLTSMVAALIIITALAIALVGPGAFSIDGHLFGRREIVIPPRSNQQ